MTRLFLTVACATLLGCSSPDLEANSAAIAPSHAAPVSRSIPATGASDAGAPTTAGSVVVDCGNVQVSLASGAVSRSVLLSRGSGEPVPLPSPDEMAGYVPVGLACSPAQSGEPFIAVQYGEADAGCEVCEWIYVYDTGGRLLNNNRPLFLRDPALPPAQQQYPNNSSYAALATRLGLSTPQFHFAPAH